jgi:hypothetical protein
MAADLHISPADAQSQLTEYNLCTAKAIHGKIHLSHVKGINHEIFIAISVQLVLLTSGTKSGHTSYL